MNKTINPRLVKRIGYVGIALFLLFLGYFISLRWLDFPFASSALDKEWVRAQKNGIPLTRDDLKPNPPLSDKDNAAVVLKEITVKIRKGTNRKESPPKPELSREAKFEQEKVENLARVEPYLATITEASKKPGFFSDYDFDRDYELIFPELSGYRNMAKALAARASLRGQKGDFNGAIQDLQTGYRLSHLLSTDQALIVGLLVSASMYAINSREVEVLAGRFAQDPARLKQLRTVVLEPSIPPNTFEASLRGEMYMVVSLMRNDKRYGGINRFIKYYGNMPGRDDEMYINPRVPIRRTGQPTGMRPRAFLMKNLKFWNTVIESQLWKAKNSRELGLWMDRLVFEEIIAKTDYASDYANIILLPVFREAGAGVVAAEAKKRTLRSLLLVLEYNAKHHRFPKDLKEAGADAEDPFIKGAPLHYKTDGKSAMIWSVGKNLKDDGGETKEVQDMVSEYPMRKRK